VREQTVFKLHVTPQHLLLVTSPVLHLS